ncbi:hypothetical protein GF420_05435 [candidate division GN15 bacterium]|nr:hypothetical protein [candidate division GN15 bacterium]
MKAHRLQSEKGIVTIIALIMVGMLTLIGLAALSTSDDEVSIAGNELQEMRAFYAAEAGLERAAADLQAQYEATGVPPTVMPVGADTLNKCRVAYRTDDDGAPTQRILTTGTLAGLHALVKSFTISALGVQPGDNSRVALTQSFETALVPIFQFAVFYGNDLEIAPGPDMTLIGRVHSNGNLWLQAGNTLTMDSYVTASGEILHGRKGAGGVSNGDVRIKDAAGNYQSMTASGAADTDGDGWLTHQDTTWYNESVSRWNGRVQDGAHGQGELNLPLTNVDDPHKIIERGDSNPDSYEHKATLKFIDGQALQKVGGLWVDVTANMIADGVITVTEDKFYDQRENEWVDCTDLDVGALYDNGYAPENGVVYFSDEVSGSGDWPALRLNNGEELDAALTIASENPLYTLGDFNSVDKKPAAIMGDAVTFLSGNFDDALSTNDKSDRQATETTVNASYLTGNTETTDDNYNGGFENLPRFLEVWSGRDFNWSGSAVNLWYSEQADGDWSGSYYSPPNRNWSYDTDLDDPNKLPPETPVVRVFQRTGWRHVNVGYADAAENFDWTLGDAITD